MAIMSGKRFARKFLPKFEYFEPKTLEEAYSLLATREGAYLLAGGTDLLVLMKKGVIAPKCIININKLPGLDFIEERENSLRIGALTRISILEKSSLIAEKYVALHEAAASLGSVHIRNMATVGGNLCRASPSGDIACPLLALGAKLMLASTSGVRELPIESFFIGPGLTALKKDEILIEIIVPKFQVGAGTAFLKIGRTSVDIALVNVTVFIYSNSGVCEDVKIAFGGVAPTPIRIRKAEEMLKGRALSSEDEHILNEVCEAASEEIKPITDVRASAEYRRTVSKVLLKRAIKKALERSELNCKLMGRKL